VLVTADGYELLTDLPTDPDVLTVRGWRPVARLRGLLVRGAVRLTHKASANLGSCVPVGCPADAPSNSALP
jgi:hypothetical protein